MRSLRSPDAQTATRSVRPLLAALNAKRNREGSILSKGQSKKMSLVESSASVIAGYIITVLIQYWLYPLFGISIPVTDALVISVIIVFAAFVKNFSTNF